MLMRMGILLFCWLAVAACSSESPGGAAEPYEDEESSESMSAWAVESPTASVLIDGKAFEVKGEGFCRRVGSRSEEGPEGVLQIRIQTLSMKTVDGGLHITVTRGREGGLLVIFDKSYRPIGSWFGRFSAEDDPSEFDGGRFTFEGPMLSAPDEVEVSANIEIDCPLVADLTTE